MMPSMPKHYLAAKITQVKATYIYKSIIITGCLHVCTMLWTENSGLVSKYVVSFVSRLCEQENVFIDSKMKFVSYAAWTIWSLEII